MGVSQGASGVSGLEHQAASMQVPNVAASVHDSVNTVGSAAISKAIQQAQAQAQAHGMGSQVKPSGLENPLQMHVSRIKARLHDWRRT